MGNISDWGRLIADAVDKMAAQRSCNPTATYRLQFDGNLTFRDAAAIVPYLDELGISHLYASPYLKTRSGSGNSYAIVDYGQLNPELGGESEYRQFIDALHAHNMGQIMDVVSNHMSATPTENRWWTDVLENGPSSPYAAYFDIDWNPIKEQLHNKILLPILGNQYGQALESGELKLDYKDGAFFIRYYQMILPLDPRTFKIILANRLDELKNALPADSEQLLELESIITSLEHLPAFTETNPELVIERQREKEVVKNRLRRLVNRSTAIADFIRQNIEHFNGSPNDPHTFDDLDRLLDEQPYRLAHWKAAADEINYRRFFDINDLAAVCMEDPKVFQESHQLVFDLLVRGDVVGLRIDHIDGLFDPMEYLRRLQWGFLRALGKAAYQQLTASERMPRADEHAEGAQQPPSWEEVEPAFLDNMIANLEKLKSTAGANEPSSTDEINSASPAETDKNGLLHASLPLYVLVEKILGPEEPLPDEWLVAGTTGYDFLNLVNGLFIDRAGLQNLIKIYDRFTDQRADFREVAHESKLVILRTAMLSDLQLLAHRINRISERDRRSRDFTLNTLRLALREIMACFPVYRTYIREGEVPERDRLFIQRATAQAKRRNPTIIAALFDFIREVLLLQQPPNLDEAGRYERAMFVGRFQQVTSPVTAKGIEDTTFYRYIPLVSHNEVGADPARSPTTVEEFHRQNVVRQSQWPRSMISTSTHDTKRSEDVRAIIDVLSEIPLQWRKAVNRWARLNHRHHRDVDGRPAPSRNDEYLFYQTLIGIWPLETPDNEGIKQLIGRLQNYMEKATHEAKVHTSWINPEPEYDAGVREFAAAALNCGRKNQFLTEFQRFHEQVVNWGLYTALSQTVLKLTSPGVPDIYQGQELWDLKLVDPDNRRPVDFNLRREMLSKLREAVETGDCSLFEYARQLALSPRDSGLKLFVTWMILQFRRRHAELFQSGKYIPLEVRGQKAAHLCAFAWQGPSNADSGKHALAIIIAPRLIAQLTPLREGATQPPAPLGTSVWSDTHIMLGDLPSQDLKNLFTGQNCSIQDSQIPLSTALSDFPLAPLTSL